MNQDVTDEALSALLDGELPAEQAAALRERILEDPELAARFTSFEAADAEFSNLLHRAGSAPLPAAVQRLLQQADDNVVPLSSRRRWQPFQFFPLAAAAGVALTVGFAAALMLSPAPAGTSAGPDLTRVPGELANILATRSSGSRVETGTAGTVELMATYQSSGGPCRQYRTRAEGAQQEALACLNDGQWQVRLVAIQPAPNPNAPYQTATGGEIPNLATAIAGARMQRVPAEREAEVLSGLKTDSIPRE